MVACNLRFTEGLRKVQELLPSLGTLEWAEITFGFDLRQWRPGQDYRLNYAARRDQGGGIVLDAIHEIDYAFWLLGKPLSWKSAVSSSGTLEIETEDSADLALALERCADVRIHLDYLNPRYTRTCHVRGINGSLSWEFRSGKVTAEIQGMRTNHETGSDVNAMYVAELDHFLEALRTGRVPMNPVTEAAYTLRMALSFRDGRRG
jgi:predicted dehydrogenase